MVGPKLRIVTGWALLIAAMGVFWDAAAYWAGASDGSAGLIPAYLGMVVGLTGLTLVIWRAGGSAPGLLAGLGTVGTFIFWGGYPSYATAGGLGALALGVSMLYLPGWGRFTSPLWVSAGILGVTELVIASRNWGPISGFTLIGAAFAATGGYVLWGLASDAKQAGVPARSTALSG